MIYRIPRSAKSTNIQPSTFNLQLLTVFFVLRHCFFSWTILLSFIMIKRLKLKESGFKMNFYLHMCKKSSTFAEFLTKVKSEMKILG